MEVVHSAKIRTRTWLHNHLRHDDQTGREEAPYLHSAKRPRQNHLHAPQPEDKNTLKIEMSITDTSASISSDHVKMPKVPPTRTHMSPHLAEGKREQRLQFRLSPLDAAKSHTPGSFNLTSFLFYITFCYSSD